MSNTKNGEKKLKPAKQKRSEASQNKILEVALELFAKNGYSRTKVSDIIRLSGVSTGSFYHRFTDKMGVFSVLLERYIQENKERVDSYSLDTSQNISLLLFFELIASEICDIAAQSKGFIIAANEISKEQVDVWEKLQGLTYKICEKAASYSPLFSEDITHKDPQKAIKQAIQLTVAIVYNHEIRPAPYIPKDKAEKVNFLVNAMMGVVQPLKPLE